MVMGYRCSVYIHQINLKMQESLSGRKTKCHVRSASGFCVGSRVLRFNMLYCLSSLNEAGAVEHFRYCIYIT